MGVSVQWAPGSKVSVAVDGTLLWTNGPWSLAALQTLQEPFSKCTKHKLALVSHLILSLKQVLMCALEKHSYFHFSVHPKGLSNQVSGEVVAPLAHASPWLWFLYVLFFFLLEAGPEHRTLCVGDRGCGTPAQCQEASLLAGCPSSLSGFHLMPSLPQQNGARLFLWSVKQQPDLSTGVSYLRAISDPDAVY